MKLDSVDEGLTDYIIVREELDARENLLVWAAKACALDEDEDDCGFGAYVHDQLRKAHQRAHAAGVFEDQPGEAAWMTMHRWERVD